MRWILILLLWAHVVMALDAPQVSISVDAGRFDTVFVELSWEPVEGVDKYLIYSGDILLSEQTSCFYYEAISTRWGFETPAIIKQYHVESAGRMYWHGHHYQLIMEPQDITAAEILANQYPGFPRGYICNVESQEEQDFINDILQGIECLLGGRRSGNYESGWCWKRWWYPYEYPIIYSNWSTPPDNTVDGSMVNTAEGWDSRWIAIQRPYLIEWGDGVN